MPQVEDFAPEWEVRIVKNEKKEYSGVVESVSRFAGVFVGTLAIGGKEITNCIKEITKPRLESRPKPTSESEVKLQIEPIEKTEPKPKPKPILKPEAPTKVTEKPVKPQAEEKISPAKKVKKKTTSRQTKVKKKVGKSKNGEG